MDKNNPNVLQEIFDYLEARSNDPTVEQVKEIENYLLWELLPAIGDETVTNITIAAMYNVEVVYHKSIHSCLFEAKLRKRESERNVSRCVFGFRKFNNGMTGIMDYRCPMCIKTNSGVDQEFMAQWKDFMKRNVCTKETLDRVRETKLYNSRVVEIDVYKELPTKVPNEDGIYRFNMDTVKFSPMFYMPTPSFEKINEMVELVNGVTVSNIEDAIDRGRRYYNGFFTSRYVTTAANAPFYVIAYDTVAKEYAVLEVKFTWLHRGSMISELTGWYIPNLELYNRYTKKGE